MYAQTARGSERKLGISDFKMRGRLLPPCFVVKDATSVDTDAFGSLDR